MSVKKRKIEFELHEDGERLDRCAGCGTKNDNAFESETDLMCVRCYEIQKEMEDEENIPDYEQIY